MSKVGINGLEIRCFSAVFLLEALEESSFNCLSQLLDAAFLP